MLLNNFTKVLYSNIYGTGDPKVQAFTGRELTISRASSNLTYVYSQLNNNNSGGYAYVNPRFMGIIFGSGNTPASISDISLENRILTNIIDSNGSFSITGDKLIISQSITAKAPLTIREVGLRCVDALNLTLDSMSALLARTVLQNAIDINTGETKTFTITIDFNKFVDNTNIL